MPELDLGNVKGPQGKSAYQSALDAGYSGSEEVFNAALSEVPGHIANSDIHVTAAQKTAWDGSVRYDAAQSLSDAQQTQARGNINAAQGGYGYGESFSRIGHDNITDAEFVEMLEAKLSTMGYNTAAQVIWEDHPLVDGTIRVGTLWKSGNGGYALLTGDGYASTSVTRVKVNGVWQPFEWVNPPMNLGVEYRTTERYLGKPVYTQIINCGSMPDIGSSKDVSIAAFNVAVVTFISGWCSYYAAMFDETLLGMTMTANNSNIVIKNLNREVNSNAVMYALVKYTKTTD